MNTNGEILTGIDVQTTTVTSTEDSPIAWNDMNNSHAKEPIEGKNNKPTNKVPYDLYGNLSEQFVNQQGQITTHRSTLTTWFAWITAIQLVVINALIFITVFGDKQILPTLLDFLKFFVSATFIELLGGLFIIVRFVFSHEASDMLKHLTYVKPSSEPSSKS